MTRTQAYRSLSLVLTGAIAALALGACNKSNGANTTAPADTTNPARATSAAGDAGYAQPVAYSPTPPPALPDYQQPPIPGDGYVWTPGYWGWDQDAGDYYWAPGTWVQPPQAGLLWTPGYWRYVDGRYGFVDGYWGAQVGFYGGVNYGYGYNGDGYQGGRWQGDRFYYNQTVNNLASAHVANVYRQDVRQGGARTSFNGGAGGIQAAPTPAERAAARTPHTPPTADQARHVQQARSTPALRATANQGRPPIAATPRPGVFSGAGVVTHAQAASPYRPPAMPVRPAAPERAAVATPPPAVRQAEALRPEQRAAPARPPMSTREAPPRPVEQARAAPARPAEPAPAPRPPAERPKPDQPERK